MELMISIHYFARTQPPTYHTKIVEDKDAQREMHYLEKEGFVINKSRKLVREKPKPNRFSVKVKQGRIFAQNLTKEEAVALMAELEVKYPNKKLMIKDEAEAMKRLLNAKDR